MLPDNNISIREMQPDDYDRIYQLWINTTGMGISDADSYQNIAKFLNRNPGLSFVACNNDKVIGTILCGHDGRRGYIYHVAVAENHRGRGIGQMLVSNSLKRLKNEGIQKCHIFVFPENEIGNAFWKAIGWTRRDDIYLYSKDVY